MNSRETPNPECVDQFFHYLLQAYRSQSTLSTLPPPPEKDSIRFIDNDQNNYREKYNGDCWKLVCTWNDNDCTDFAILNKLCNKHNAENQNRISASNSSPFYPSLPNTSFQTVNKDDNIKLNTEFNQDKTTRHHTDDIIKSKFSHFKQFSIDSDDDDDDVPSHKIKSQSKSSSTSHPNPPTHIEYIGSTLSPNQLNIKELLSKKIPPLTSFEEIYLGSLLMEKYPRTCSMVDAQLYLHEETMKVVKKNYRVQMNTISSEYFYDFLLRHPHIAIHYKNWFSRCKSTPPTTGCSIDTKIWILSMMIRGTSTADEADDE